MADYRLPIYLSLPLKHRTIIGAPLLECIDFTKYLQTGLIDTVAVGGESGYNSRVCNYDWILNIRNQCIDNNVAFEFHQTGAKFIKDGKLYNVPKDQQKPQAALARINVGSRIRG